MRLTRLLSLGLLGASLASLAPAQGDPNTLDRIITEGKDRSQVMRLMRELTDIGPRLTGSSKLHAAQAWAVKRFKQWGLKNVRLEPAIEVPVGFERGPNFGGRLIEPYPMTIEFSSPNWSEGTDGPLQGPVVKMPANLAELEARRAELKGAWVLTPFRSQMGRVAGEAAELREALVNAGIAGRIVSSPDDRIHSSGSWRGVTYDNRPKGRTVIVARQTYVRLERAIDLKSNPIAEFNLDHRWTKGPVKEHNVVAEIPGTERPDEVVIVCGHLDSWNSPGSQGASDNGTGTVAAMEAARILMASKARPKRTIRFILWTGEEQGLLGSAAYVKAHEAELPKITAVLNDDGGSNYHGGYSGNAIFKEAMEQAFAPTVRAFPDLPMTFNVVEDMRRGGGSDHASFNRVGVPGFYTLEKGRQVYGRVWHTQYDRYEEVIPEYMVQSATNHAIVAFNLSERAELLPRVPVVTRAGASAAPSAPGMVEEHDHDHDHDHDHGDGGSEKGKGGGR